jgi:hypothetical protein
VRGLRGTCGAADAHFVRRDDSGVLRIAQGHRRKVFSNLEIDVRQMVVRKDLREARSQERRE